jgi:protein-L-isoaspartate(D-aspartate) O-methyltransferase
MSTPDIAGARAELAEQLRASDRAGPAVLAAFLAVPRHVFLPRLDVAQAYKDTAIVTKTDARALGRQETGVRPQWNGHGRYRGMR